MGVWLNRGERVATGAWIDAIATRLSRGGVLTLSLPARAPVIRFTEAVYDRPARVLQVTAGPYQSAVTDPDWRVLGAAGEPLFVGGDAWDVASFIVRTAVRGVDDGCEYQAKRDADDTGWRLDELEPAFVRCDLWLMAYRSCAGRPAERLPKRSRP